MTHNNQDQDFLDIVPDPTVKEILRKQINQVAFNDDKFNKKLQKSKIIESQLNIIQKPIGLESKDDNNHDYEDYEAELNPFKRQRMYEFIQPEKFKKIGYMNDVIRKPVFRMTDLYLPPNQKIQRLIDRIFRQKIHGKQTLEPQLETQFDNVEQLNKIYNQWQTKQDYDEFQNDRNDLTEKDLEEIVVNMGDKKENYFLLMRHEKQEKRIEKTLQKPVKNLPIANPNFLKNFKKSVSQLAQKNRIIQQFESQNENDQRQSDKLILGGKSDKKAEQAPTKSKLFGSIKNVGQKSTKLKFLVDQSSSTIVDPLLYPIVEETISLQVKEKYQKSFNQDLIKYYSYSNKDIVNDLHKGPLEKLNRIQYNLANPNFFLPKLHIALERQQDFANVKGTQYKQQGQFGRQNVNLSQLNKSKISDSLFTGNRQQLSKPSMMDGSAENIYPMLEDDQQTIEKRLETQLRNIYKEPLHHSDLAVRFDLINFTLDDEEFAPFHRHNFMYSYYFKTRTPVKLSPHKPRKVKPKDLIINTEMKNSNIKYNKQEALSASEGEFIMIEYIEEHPLLMSSVGMCERMFIQINYQEMLQKINQDMIKNAPIDDIEELRDNPTKNNSNNINNNNFERKCDLWRENIKENFGENGKLFLWQPKMAGKLIGSPEGLGVALMQSNLATYPIVKKKLNPKSRDFLLVREDGKWFIRKIDHIYVSGQVEPKKKIFNPDSRQYTVFKSNYEKAFMRREISLYGSVNFDHVKRIFSGQSQASLKKALKAIRAISNDNKNYSIMQGYENYEYELTAEDVCLYERMQKSISLLKQVGITQIRNNQKMKNVLKEFNKRHIESLERFTISRMIKDQLLLTSWYLTDSFIKFKIKAAKIQISGMADPTNGRGGYSYINKPQKERTAKQDMDDKSEKPKVSGTTWDLRKLKTKNTTQILMSLGHKEEQLKGKGRWGLVGMIRRQQNTEYARKQRETKPQKAQNQKKEISRVFNKMLAYLNGQQPSPVFNYNFKKKISLDELMQKEKLIWVKTKERISKGEEDKGDDNEEDDDFYDEPGDD